MDNKDQTEQFKELLKRNGEFIAKLEIGQEKIEVSQKNMTEHARSQQQNLNDQLSAIEQQTNALHQLMTEAGAARFRIAAEENLRQGELHIEQLNKICSKQSKYFQQQQQQLESIAAKYMLELKKTESRIAKNMINFLKRLNVEEMRELADEARTSIEKSSANAISQSRQLLRRFRFKNIFFVLLIVFINSLVIGLYLNDEMPWEIHKHSMHERHAGQALQHAWSSLPDESKHIILAHSRQHIPD